MRLGPSTLLLALALATTSVAGQGSQNDTSTADPRTSALPSAPANRAPQAPSLPSSSTPADSPSSTRSPSEPARTPSQPAQPLGGTPLVPPPAPLQAPPIGGSAAAPPIGGAAAGAPTPQNPCPGTSAPAPASSSFPGVSASQLPRAGVSADAFVRPGVSAAQLSTLLPFARSGPCGRPRDVVLYPDTGTPLRRVPPAGEDQP